MRTTNQLTLVSLLAMSVVGCGAGTTGSSDNPPVPPSATSVGVSAPGKLFGITTVGDVNGASVQAVESNSIVYHLPIVNTSGSALSISSVQVSNPTGSTAWSSDIGACATIPADSECAINVGFYGDGVTDADALNSIVTVTYSNGTVSTIPVSGNVVEPGSLEVSLPSTIAPNTAGLAYGVITVFNGTDDEQSIDANDIVPEVQTGVSWTFVPNCDGNGSNLVEPLQSCSVGFIYQVSSIGSAPVVPAAISVSVPLVNTVTQMTTIAQPVSTSLPPASTTTPRPFISYNGGAVSLSGTTASFNLSNVGNGTLSMINVTGLPTGVTQTNTCNNVLANATCTVTLNRASDVALTSATINVEGIASVAVNSVNVSVTGQQLAVSPATIDFGTNYGGAVLQRTVTVSNTNASALTGVTTNLATGMPYSVVSNNCANGTLGRFASCQVVLGYTAPNEAATQTDTFTVGATNQQNVDVSLTARSILSNWNNLMSVGTGYTDTGASIISLLALDGDLIFGNSMAPGVAGARNVWGFDSNANAFELAGLTGMSSGSAPTAIAYYSVDAAYAYIGKYDGSFYKCDTDTDACTSIGLSADGLGVTSVVQVSDNIAFAGLSDKSTGTTGAVWFYNGTGSAVPIVSGQAVGKMAISGNTLYVPLHTVSGGNSVSLVAAVNATTGALIGQPMAINAFAANEYFTVLYTSGETIYGGTNLGNVYSAPIANLSASSWTKLTTSVLSSTSIVTGLAVVNNQLYVGLGRLNNSISGGALYTYLNNAFTTVPGYTDTSSVSALTSDADSLYVGTYAGNLWDLTVSQ